MRRVPIVALTLVTSLLACDKSTPTKTPEPVVAEPVAETDPVEDEAAKKQAEDDARWAKHLEDAEAEAVATKARWTPELQAKYTKLVDAKYSKPAKALAAILASDHRAPGNAERDQYRHPAETLAFFGIKPNMKVFEWGQGAGWYTEILAPYLAKSGTLFLGVPAPDESTAKGRFATRATQLFFESSGPLYAKVQKVEQPAGDDSPIAFGPDGSLDAILVFRMLHGDPNIWDRLMPAAFAALAPGGILAIEQHRAAEGANPDESVKQGYLPEAFVIEKIESYGFKLAEKSEINANPKDTKDYPDGVWTLPPTLSKGDEDKDKYLAIGESDRSTLRFVKPK
jgi:predicted methyltransferase